MAEEGLKNETTEEPKRQPAQEPSIHTMKSDVAEFLKATKPSLIDILTKEAQEHERRGVTAQLPSPKIPLRAIVIGGLIAILILGGYLTVLLLSKEEAPSISKPVPPPALLATEKSRTIIVKSGSESAVLAGLNESAEEKEREGVIKRLIFKIREKNGQEHFMESGEFFAALDINPLVDIVPLLGNNFTAAIYYQIDGPRFIFIVPVERPERAEAGMLSWEIGMQRDLASFFLKEKVEVKLSPFEDRSFRNIEWRYLKLHSLKDVGLAYSIFKAKNYLIITTSKESMETVVARLFE